MKTNNPVIVIGAGGITSYLLPILTRMVHHIILIDGDKIEERNLDRQNLRPKFIGKYKVEDLHDQYGHLTNLIVHPRFLADREELPELLEDSSLPNEYDTTWIICAVDNNKPRQIAMSVDERLLINPKAIITANETHSWDAMFYSHEWSLSQYHPLKYYPELGKDDGLDPTAPACTSEEAIANSGGQLPLANALAAVHGLQLFKLWQETPSLDNLPDICPNRPFRYNGNGIHTVSHTIINP